MFKTDEIKSTLLEKKFPEGKVEQYTTYCYRLSVDKDKTTGKLKNEWITKKSSKNLSDWFIRVAEDGLFIDGKSISLSSRGITYDYQAFKNKMYLAYPESVVDVQLVYKDDVFSVSKKSGEVYYSHDVANPFGQIDADVIGGYCVIKNKRGEFLTLLSKEDIDKHRKTAQTDKIWKSWFKEMCLKTVIKKACSLHFRDVYENIEDIDNESNYSLDNPLDIETKIKSEIDDISTEEGLKAYYNKNKGKLPKGSAILTYIQKKQLEIRKGG